MRRKHSVDFVEYKTTLLARFPIDRDYFYLVTDESYYGDIRQTAFEIPRTILLIDIGFSLRRGNADRNRYYGDCSENADASEKFLLLTRFFFNPASRA